MFDYGSEDEAKTKYFFASIKYNRSDPYTNGGKWAEVIVDKVFELDHYPSREEILDIVYGRDSEEYKEYYFLPDLLSYNELTKEAYNAYKKI